MLCVHACTCAPQSCEALYSCACARSERGGLILRSLDIYDWNKSNVIKHSESTIKNTERTRRHSRFPGETLSGNPPWWRLTSLTSSHIRGMLSYIAPLTIIGWQQTCYYTPSKNLWELSLVPCRRTRGTRIYSRQCFVTQAILCGNKNIITKLNNRMKRIIILEI